MNNNLDIGKKILNGLFFIGALVAIYFFSVYVYKINYAEDYNKTEFYNHYPYNVVLKNKIDKLDIDSIKNSKLNLDPWGETGVRLVDGQAFVKIPKSSFLHGLGNDDPPRKTEGKLEVDYLGNEVFADVNGDGKNDALFMITEQEIDAERPGQKYYYFVGLISTESDKIYVATAKNMIGRLVESKPAEFSVDNGIIKLKYYSNEYRIHEETVYYKYSSDYRYFRVVESNPSMTK